MNEHTVIVGAGQAGLAIATSLRQLGSTGRITMIGSETFSPYERPPLSKDYLAGKSESQDLLLRTDSYYTTVGIEVIRGAAVQKLELRGRGATGQATLGDGRAIDFDRLALAVGARPRRLDHLRGHDLEGVTYLRTLTDAATIRKRLALARNVVVIGGGFIGLEVAAVASKPGTSVTVVEAAERLLSRAVAPQVSEFFRDAHMRRDVDIRLSRSVVGFVGDGRVLTGVELDHGEILPADVVVIGVGVEPRTELARQLGLEIDEGIVVDEHTRTSAPGIVAAGDCTSIAHPSQERRLRLESVDNALTQGKAAAHTLMGRPSHARHVPWFWSFQGDIRLQIAGLTASYDDVVVRGRPADENFSVLYYRGETLLGIDAVNRPADYMAVRVALSQGATIPRSRAADISAPLKELFTSTTPKLAELAD